MAALPVNHSQPLDDAVFVIFGVTGDLAKRKLLPALYHLARRGMLTERFRILGITRRDTEVDDIIAGLRNALESAGTTIDEAAVSKLRGMLGMVKMEITKPEDYINLREALEQEDPITGTPLNRLYYLAVPPAMFGTIVNSLGQNNLQIRDERQLAESRLLIEKPFGYDTASAIELIKEMEQVFS